MALKPDKRWTNFVAGFDASGQPIPFDLFHLEEVTIDWQQLVEDTPPVGPFALLRTARSLVVQSWFDYELLVQASLVGLQALESATRTFLYPDDPPGYPLRKLVARAYRDGVFSDHEHRAVDAAVQLRNSLSHPEGGMAFPLGMAEGILRTSHLVVRDLWQLRQFATAQP